jgi:signal transduction histidine kinase
VIVVQAGAAEDVFDTRPDQARAALGSIERAGRDALRELRRLLSAVRPGEPGAGATQPQPGLDRLDDLAEPLRAGGLAVVVRREGPAAELPAGVDLSAYRIVQEALSNAARYAPGSSVRVRIRYGGEQLFVSVIDDGAADPVVSEPGGGHGLIGMRERVAFFGGEFSAGPGEGGGYALRARFPLPAVQR